VDPQQLSTMSDADLWSFLGSRLDQQNDWSHYLVGPATVRIRQVLVKQQESISSEMRRPEVAANSALVTKLKRTLNRVQMRMPEVNAALKSHNRKQTEVKDAARDRSLAHALKLLALQVIKHEAVVTAAGRTSSPADHALWESLTWIRVTTGGGTESLAWMVDHHWSQELTDSDEE